MYVCMCLVQCHKAGLGRALVQISIQFFYLFTEARRGEVNMSPSSAFCVSICTVVPVKQLKRVPEARMVFYERAESLVALAQRAYCQNTQDTSGYVSISQRASCLS